MTRPVGILFWVQGTLFLLSTWSSIEALGAATVCEHAGLGV